MKNRILSAILLATVSVSTFANEIEKDLMTDEMMNNLEITTPKYHQHFYQVSNDYFQANKCSDDITGKVSIAEIKEFAKTYQFSILIGLKTQDTPITKANYLALISAYKLMNCGNEKAMSSYITATSSIAVELVNKKGN
jgi:hypothetical protein